MARRNRLLLLLVAVTLPWCALRVHSYELTGVSWPDSVAEYVINPNFPTGLGGDEDQQVEAVRCGADVWQNQGTAAFDFDYDGTTTIDELDVEDGVNVTFFTDAEALGGTIAATLTSFDSITDELLEFDIVFYGENANGEIDWNGVGDPSGDQIDILSTAAHEFGHALGLGHSDDTDATMYTFDNGVQARALEQDDVDGVEDVYGASDDTDPAPVILSVEPDTGGVEGGNAVTITGANFTWKADTTVILDGDELDEDDWELDSCATLRITSMPDHAAGFVVLEIENELGSVTLEDAYEYTGSVPEITGVRPGAGPVAGGTPVVVLGSGFEDDAEVTIGGEPLEELEVENANRITGLTPAGDEAGAVDVVVTQLGGEVTLEDGFLYSTDELVVDEVTAGAGSVGVEVGVLASNELELDGFSMGVNFDSSQVTCTDVTLDGTEAEDAVFVGAYRDNEDEPDGGFWTLGVVMTFSTPDDNLPAGEDQLIAIAVYDISEDVEADTRIELNLEDGLSFPTVDVEFVLDDLSIVPTMVDGAITVTDARTFIRGDANEDGNITLGDGLKILNHIFAEGELECQDTGDFDNNGSLSLADALKLLEYIFNEGAEPEPPFPDPGVDPGEPDELECE